MIFFKKAVAIRTATALCLFSVFLTANSLDLVKGFYNILFGRSGKKRSYDDGDRAEDKCGKKLVNVPCAAKRTDEELPDEYDSTVGKYTCECACLGSSLPK